MDLTRPLAAAASAAAALLLALSATLAAGQVRPVTPVQPVRPVATPSPSWAPRQPSAPVQPVHPATRPAPPSWTHPATPAPAPAAPDATPPPDARPSYPPRKGDTPQELVDAPRFDLLPNRRFDSAKDYAACLELQKQTGLCILLYFANLNDVSQKGLCHWWEKKLQNSREWQRAAKNYLCVNITLPGNAEDRALAEKMRVKTTPAVFVIPPNDNWPKRINVITWSEQKEPLPATPAEGLQMLHDASTPAYKAVLAPLMH